jgi:four helix bundle protein
MRNDKDNIIVNKTIEFSLTIINYCETLEQKKKFVISKQLLRSATSIGANVLKHKMQRAKQILFIK